MNNDILQDLLQEVKAKNLHILNMNIRQNGEIIAKYDFKEEEPILLWSVSKTFTSMAVGIAISEGYLKLDDYVTDYVSNVDNLHISEGHKKITVHDLLCMGTGQGSCPVEKFDWQTDKQVNICKLFFEEPVITEPGSQFTYNNSATYMLSKIIQTVTGVSLLDYADEKIFQPLGISKPQWDTCPLGITLGFSGLYLTASELSKFGQLLLDRGVWEGNQIIPLDYIEKATSVQIQTDDFNKFFATADHRQGYGYQVWMNSYANSYRMDGLFGQYVVILPDKNAVVTYVSNEPENMTGVMELTWNTLTDKL